VFYKGNGLLKKVKVLSYGVNKMGDTEGLIAGIHAEHDALLKIIPNRKRRLKNVNLLVIRVSGRNKLQSSKPCNNCIETMKRLSIKKGYKIQNVYYSDNNENIVKTTLYDLENDEKHYSKYYRKICNS
jgi:cytidine deaminase